MKRAVAEATQRLEAQLADLRAKLGEKERELVGQRSELAEKTVALVQKDRQIAELQAALKAAQAEVETLRAQAAPVTRTMAAEAPAPASTPCGAFNSLRRRSRNHLLLCLLE